MISFLSNLIDTVKSVPDRPAIVDRDGTRTTTYKEFFDYAQRVNSYLRMKGISREDVVAIHFQKGMEYIVTRIGIMMSGAAWVGLEDFMGKDRIDYVIRNSGCKMVFNKEVWDEAMMQIPCDEIADSAPHDLAFIIYTSGSTGTPKGAAQEYGIYENIQEGTHDFFGKYSIPEPMNFAHVSPQTFVSGIYSTAGTFGVRGTIHEISMNLARDPQALISYFIKHKVHHTFMTPTFFNLILSNPEISLRAASTGGEVVSGVYADRFDIINVYSASEYGYPTCLYKIDKPYENTPIGYPTCDSDIILIDENGNKSSEGRFCIHLPYFRGYMDKGHESAISDNYIIIDKKNYLKTFDYVRREEDGKYIVLGRLDDMVKLNGNRVSTKEVETAIKKALSVDLCAVKLFINNGIRALCAYYTGDKDYDSTTAADILRNYIPEYMIPSYYIKLKSMPLNSNGKVDRKNLPDPETFKKRFSSYSAPRDELEEKLCKGMQKALNVDMKIGIDDDFFILGGDSIRAMELLADTNINGITVQMIYEGRTVRKIVSLFKEYTLTQDKLQNAPDKAPLNIGQLYLLQQDLKHPGTCMFNLPLRFDFYKTVNMEDIASSVQTAVIAHPALYSTIEESGNRYFLKYNPNATIAFKVEKMSDEELECAVKAFVRPFSLDGEPLFRCQIIEGDSRSVLLIDVYHVICDGFSLEKLITDIESAYMNESLSSDANYMLLHEEALSNSSQLFKRDMDYFEAAYNHPGFNTMPIPDHDTSGNLSQKLFMGFNFNQEKTDSLEKKYGLGKNGFYISAALLTLAAYNMAKDVMITWTWHGRSDSRRMNSVGYFTKDLPIALNINNALTISLLFEDITRQIREGISHGSVSYWEEKNSYNGNDLTCLLYQGDVYEYHDSEKIVSSFENLEISDSSCNNTLDIEILDGRDRFGVLFEYNSKMYESASMERFGKMYCEICEKLLSGDNMTPVADIILKVKKEVGE